MLVQTSESTFWDKADAFIKQGVEYGKQAKSIYDEVKRSSEAMTKKMKKKAAAKLVTETNTSSSGGGWIVLVAIGLVVAKLLRII